MNLQAPENLLKQILNMKVVILHAYMYKILCFMRYSTLILSRFKYLDFRLHVTGISKSDFIRFPIIYIKYHWVTLDMLQSRRMWKISRPTSWKQVVTAPLLNARQLVTVCVATWRTLAAQWPWLPNIHVGQNSQPFKGKGDFSIWVKNSRRKTLTNKHNVTNLWVKW